MKILIKLDKRLYKYAKHHTLTSAEIDEICDVIANGTPLPKGHGRLKDIDRIISDGRSKGFCDWYDEMKYAPTIIEADTESEDKE